jgi:hypothetical protein
LLASISVAHPSQLCNTSAYRKRNASYQPARPIGERRKPQPKREPEFQSIETVHQGDQDGCKGLYHINAVGEVTQWEVVAAAPSVYETFQGPPRSDSTSPLAYAAYAQIELLGATEP